MSYPTESELNNSSYNNNNESVGYPKFSEIHEYPKIEIPKKRGNPYNQNNQQYPKPQPQQQYPKPQPQQQYPKPQPQQQYPKPYPQQNNPNTQYAKGPIKYVRKDQMFVSQNGHQYVAVPVGPPKLVPVLVPQKKFTPQYPESNPKKYTKKYPNENQKKCNKKYPEPNQQKYPQPNPNTYNQPYYNAYPQPYPQPYPNAYANGYPNYNTPYYPPAQPYPYYPPPPPPPPSGGNTIVVIPPGYEVDYSPGYSPFGDLLDDLDNLF